jgi:hypothetical protein
MKLSGTQQRRWPHFLAFLLLYVLVRNLFAGPGTDAEWEASFRTTNTFWGSATNGLKAGLQIDETIVTNGSAIICTPLLKNIDTNILWIYLPPMQNRINLTLSNEHGDSVVVTDLGKQLGRPLTEPLRLRTGINTSAGFSGCPPLDQDNTEILPLSQFRLQDYFNLRAPGVYTLKFQMFVIRFPPGSAGGGLTAGAVPIVGLPLVKARIEVR